MSLLKSTLERVRQNTSVTSNERIRQHTLTKIDEASQAGREAIDRRLGELDREWDVERCLETGASTLMLASLVLGYRSDRRWFFLSGGIAGLLLQHALQGWCPPLPLFRRLGVRTADEINQERFTLKALRGDFVTAPKAQKRHQGQRIYDLAGR
jgi:hypothetical protein